MKKIMLVSSSGGHWVQLKKLLPACSGNKIVMITTDCKYIVENSENKILIVPDASRWSRIKLLILALVMFKHIIIERPNVVITTGAAPGFFAIYFGKKFKAKTIWIDSLANVNKMSMSAILAKKYADVWLTQWVHLTEEFGAKYWGSII